MRSSTVSPRKPRRAGTSGRTLETLVLASQGAVTLSRWATCQVCGKRFYRFGASRGKFCSIPCFRERQRNTPKRDNSHLHRFITLTARGLVAAVPLHRGGFALVDAADAPLVEHLRWARQPEGYAVHTEYARGENRPRGVSMHRLVAGNVPRGLEVDHKNGVRLDNRKSNLRVVPRWVNNLNRDDIGRGAAGAVGVSWSKSKGVWRVRIRTDGRENLVGYFADRSEAAAAYLRARDAIFAFIDADPLVFVRGDKVDWPSLIPVVRQGPRRAA